MSMQLVTGNHAAGHSMSLAGEANRAARGAVCGIYPITPQTEIVEYVAKYPFSKGSVVPVESEHSAMSACVGASAAGARVAALRRDWHFGLGTRWTSIPSSSCWCTR